MCLTHWGWVTHIYICVCKLSIICSDNGMLPGRHQAIIWTNVGILLIRTLETKFSEILSKIHAFSFKKMHLKIMSAKWRPFCPGGDELNTTKISSHIFSPQGWNIIVIIYRNWHIPPPDSLGQVKLPAGQVNLGKWILNDISVVLKQDCSISSALATEVLQSCPKPSM